MPGAATYRGTPEVKIKVEINGVMTGNRVPARLLLSDYIRDVVGLTGTHVGCEHGVCGACTVIVDGKATRSCSVLAVQADGSKVRTVEDLAINGQLSPMQRAFHRNYALQCGFCTPGFLMTLESVEPTEYSDLDDLLDLLAGHLCRCTGYRNIVTAVRDAWQQNTETGAPEGHIGKP